MTPRPGHYDGSDEAIGPADQALLASLLPPLDDRPGPARRLSSAASAAMVRSIVDAALAAQIEEPAEAQAAPSARSWSARRLLAPAAAALLVISFGAGAGALVGHYVVNASVEPVEPPRALRAPKAAPRVASPPAPSPQELMELPAPVPVAPPAPTLAPSHRRHKIRRHVRAPISAGAPITLPEIEEIDLATAPVEDLLAVANERRRERLWGEADELYRTVVHRFPKTDAAAVAEVASAALHVEQLGDPAGALEAYQRALSERPTGSLAEEARWGIVEAWRALGDPARESAALAQFLEHHPNSALAPAARRRQGELGR